jgi:glycosyltransferase involved in cell wall biosynthesis
MNEPRGVSTIVVNYNHAEFLPAAINSALVQEYPICEVIVVDDCSTDNSSAVCDGSGCLDSFRGELAKAGSRLMVSPSRN